LWAHRDVAGDTPDAAPDGMAEAVAAVDVDAVARAVVDEQARRLGNG